ncbi:MAG: SufE family protein [Natronohydrobacter sp.]|nr:SufE family protein [Natronohydrobacter sp.]
MATARFEDIAETFEFLDDWEDRYRHVIELGRAMPPMEEALKTPATKVEGCASQVWIHPVLIGEGPEAQFDFAGDSDAMIVRGLIAVLHALYSGLTLREAAQVDAIAELGRLGLDEHLSSQRSNGLRAMVGRITALTRSA